MNDFNNESGAVPDGFSAVSMDELDQVDGGLAFLLPLVYGVSMATGALAGYIGTSKALEGSGTLNAIRPLSSY
jgi:hypothetical protein